MKSITKLIIFIIFAAVIIGVIIVWEKTLNERPFKPLNFNSDISIHNKTNHERADTICMVLADKILGLDSAHIYLLPLANKNPDFKFYGITQQLHIDPYVYYIYLADDLSFGRLKYVLCHEFVHVDQFNRGDLVYRAPHYYWKEKLILPAMPYKQRPFEIEAFTKERAIFKRLNKLLY